MDMLNQLRRLNTETSTLDELIALETFAVQLQLGYDKHQVPTPDWLGQALKTLAGDRSQDSGDSRAAPP
jgi:hypothetical protein